MSLPTDTPTTPTVSTDQCSPAVRNGSDSHSDDAQPSKGNPAASAPLGISTSAANDDDDARPSADARATPSHTGLTSSDDDDDDDHPSTDHRANPPPTGLSSTDEDDDDDNAASPPTTPPFRNTLRTPPPSDILDTLDPSTFKEVTPGMPSHPTDMILEGSPDEPHALEVLFIDDVRHVVVEGVDEPDTRYHVRWGRPHVKGGPATTWITAAHASHCPEALGLFQRFCAMREAIDTANNDAIDAFAAEREQNPDAVPPVPHPLPTFATFCTRDPTWASLGADPQRHCLPVALHRAAKLLNMSLDLSDADLTAFLIDHNAAMHRGVPSSLLRDFLRLAMSRGLNVCEATLNKRIALHLTGNSLVDLANCMVPLVNGVYLLTTMTWSDAHCWIVHKFFGMVTLFDSAGEIPLTEFPPDLKIRCIRHLARKGDPSNPPGAMTGTPTALPAPNANKRQRQERQTANRKLGAQGRNRTDDAHQQ
ncbi:hypothetical protein H310_13726 [Aphanomyces invadans]|uniref:Uncharacterized protein n=1 Tax=Aphanomyces invadans TaxID=157072 RepID=A0A024TD25_9STRA|nr:hypothetical protein H310_13726 [Aphanomyces invadans]ETV91938.1 hypothetical protein H310_13726 [Aphanomyces invadans]RHY27860.1 hypothetical protein DYB32_006479 [Aphanomyces invadans]|eukprot:XP_008879575.1 hypothetical protein H310_13726 [Aphanomyces invadans]